MGHAFKILKENIPQPNIPYPADSQSNVRETWKIFPNAPKWKNLISNELFFRKLLYNVLQQKNKAS